VKRDGVAAAARRCSVGIGLLQHCAVLMPWDLLKSGTENVSIKAHLFL
jgi:hypothetical protein